MSASASSSTCPHRSSGISPNFTRYTDDDNRVVIEWRIGDKVRFLSYPNGRGTKAEKAISYYDEKTISQRIDEAAKALQNGEGCIWTQAKKGRLLKPQPSLVCIVPETINIVTSFPRHPESEEDLSTPLSFFRWKEFLGKFKIQHSVFGLKPSSCKIVDQAIFDFLKTDKSEKISKWVEYAHQNVFNKWVNDGEWIRGYHSFSNLAWGITSHFILGVSPNDHVDYAYLWNDMFSPDTNLLVVLKLLKMDYQNGMIPFFLQQIQKIRENPSDYPDTFPTYWLNLNIHDKLMNSLTPKEIEEAEKCAKNLKIDLISYFLLCTTLTISIGMQENFSFTVTETLKQVSNDASLLERCKNSASDCHKAVQETLRLIPPAAHGGQVRWDTTIIYGTQEQSKIYDLDKGDIIETHPLYTSRNPEIYMEPEVYDIDRKSKGKVCPFGKGPHRCPGEIIALNWMSATVHSLISTYRVQVENPTTVEYGVYFTLKSMPEVKMRVSSFEEEPPQLLESKSWIANLFSDFFS